MKDFYDEFLPLFEAEDFNVCCDEAALDDKNGVPKSIRFAKYISELAAIVAAHGKRLNIWADCVDMQPSPLACMPEDTIYLDYSYTPDRPNTKKIS